MIEIFTDISEDTKTAAKLIFDTALQLDPIKMTKMLNDYTNALAERDQEFVRFYFQMRMRQIIDESDNNQR